MTVLCVNCMYKGFVKMTFWRNTIKAEGTVFVFNVLHCHHRFSETAKVNKQVLRHVIQLSTHIEYNFVLY